MRHSFILYHFLRLSLLTLCLILILPLSHRGQPRYTRQYVSVAGKKMSYETFGLSTRRPRDPVLIFEGGFGASGVASFKDLFPALSKFSSGVAYDRNGEGDADTDTTLLTDADLIHRLHAFLNAIHVPPPYILVGHSMGGAYIRLFTALYPDEVAGLVFIDSPDFMLTDQQDEEIKRISHSDKGTMAWIIPAMDKMAADTSMNSRARQRAKRMAALFRMGPFREYDSLPPLPDIPVAVLIAYNKSQDTIRTSSVDRSRIQAAGNVGILNYAAMIANNHHSSMTLLPGYGHSIHSEDPDLVVSVIKRVVQDSHRL